MNKILLRYSAQLAELVRIGKDMAIDVGYLIHPMHF